MKRSYRLQISSLGCFAVAFAIAISAPPVNYAHGFEIFGWKFFEGDEEKGEIEDPITYKADLKVDTTGVPAKSKKFDQLKELEASLQYISALISDQDKPASGVMGLVARAKSDQSRLLGGLYDEAYYAPKISIFINGKPFDKIDILGRLKQPAKISVKIKPGPIFRYAKINITSNKGKVLVDVDKIGIKPGNPAKANEILIARDQALLKLREQGYPQAKVTDVNTIADHQAKTISTDIKLHTGRKAKFGDMTIKGLEKVDEPFVRHQANVKKGEPYTPKDVKKTLNNLRDLAVFDQISVVPAQKIEADGSLPVVLQLHERKRHVIGFGAGWSTVDGGEIGGYWGHRNLFGHAEQLLIQGKITRIGKKAAKPSNNEELSTLKNLGWEGSIQLKQPGFITFGNTLTSRIAYGTQIEERYRRTGLDASMIFARKITQRASFDIGVAGAISTVEDGFGENKYNIISIPVSLRYDAGDDKLNPTTGYRLLASVTPSYDWLNKNKFVSARAMASVYQAIDTNKRYILAGQLETGATFGAELKQIPADKRYYLGGGGSLRGFEYLSLGPQSPNGKLVGGISFWRASLEARIGVTDSISVVPFVDIGMAFDSPTPKFGDKPRYGAGLGVRYNTAIGPLRIDVAVPLKRQKGEKKFAIYAGIGQSF